MTGKIHSLESFSKVDGPGIRYVIFMQGCNLRCKFCHNPDTWDRNAGKDMQVEELVQTILRSKTYMDASNGGVTISGGEPLIQLPFLTKLCKRLKEENVHVTIDTSGNIDLNTPGLDELLDNVDLILFDVKHIRPDEHKKLIGVDNKRILNFLEYISNVRQIPVWIRIVYLPTITDKENSLKEYKEYLNTIKSIEKIEVLPYHEMGKYKWDELNLKYELNDIRIPSKEECKKIEKYLNSKL